MGLDGMLNKVGVDVTLVFLILLHVDDEVVVMPEVQVQYMADLIDEVDDDEQHIILILVDDEVVLLDSEINDEMQDDEVVVLDENETEELDELEDAVV